MKKFPGIVVHTEVTRIKGYKPIMLITIQFINFWEH